MADIVNEFEVVLTTYFEVKEAHPDWSDIAIEDYMARLRDVIQISERGNVDSDRITVLEIKVAVLELRVDDLEDRVTYLEGSTVVTAVDVTATGNQVIICTDILTVTMALAPLDKDVVEVKSTNGNVIIDGNGNTIDGSSTVTIRRNNTGLSMEYSSVADAWFII